MRHRNGKTLGILLALVVIAPSWAAAGIEQKQLQAVKDLAMETFGIPIVSTPEGCKDAFTIPSFASRARTLSGIPYRHAQTRHRSAPNSPPAA